MSEKRVVLNLGRERIRRDLLAHERLAWLGAYDADVTIDGKTLILTWDYEDATPIPLRDLIHCYLEHGMGRKNPLRKHRGKQR